MDIQKEEDDFNAWFNKQTINAVPDADLSLQRLWASLAWQAAKAQAVPEGYKVVPINYECVWCGCTELDGWTDNAMIESQHPSSTPGCPDEP